jgi:hypothetical protein
LRWQKKLEYRSIVIIQSQNKRRRKERKKEGGKEGGQRRGRRRRK